MERTQPYFLSTVGGVASRGPGLTFTEAQAVLSDGRISPQDVGLWSDEQIEPFSKVIDSVHPQNQKIGTQLAHADVPLFFR